MTASRDADLERADLVQRFDSMSSEVSLDDEELREIFSEAGIDKGQVLMKVLEAARRLDDELRKAEYQLVADERARVLSRLDVRTVNEGREDLLKRLERLRRRMPAAAAMYKDLAQVPDEDLVSLIAELEFLDSSDDE